ncbi:hypothetical protein [Zoogloea sp.]|uniref:hypothetical protein n=1 Tax=Zoogloea sp. TaxID=49181 RepID=UPI002622DDAE|nr:hypothetical protein [Zoogloea sp.]MDD3354160.1 hypothetical protein [Zoogloea sp.]
MSTITVDTLELVSELKQAGIPQEQAEAVVRTIVKAHEGLVTTAHLDRLETKLDGKFAVVDAKFDKLTWMLAAVLGVALANFAKQFF